VNIAARLGNTASILLIFAGLTPVSRASASDRFDRQDLPIDSQRFESEDANECDDPDLPTSFGCSIDKAEYLALRSEHVARLRGFPHALEGNPRAVALTELDQEMAVQAIRSRFDPLSNSTSWTSIGPAPIPDGQTSPRVAVSGRVSAIAIHPANASIAYVGTAQGGLYRTLDGGATWTALMDTAQSLAIGAVAIDPVTPSTVFVGTGEANLSLDSFWGVGLYRITNADTLPILAGPFETRVAGTGSTAGNSHAFLYTSISKIIIDPANDNRIFVGNHNGVSGANGQGLCCGGSGGAIGLYFCPNAQAASPTFSLVNGVTPSQITGVSDVVFEPGSSNNLLVTLYDYSGSALSGVWRSTNAAAASQSPSTSPAFVQTLAFGARVSARLAINKVGAAVTAVVAYGVASGTVVKSTDGGATWPTTLAAVAGFCGGQCFYDIGLAIDPGNASNLYIGGQSATIFKKSTDGGTTFNPSQSTLHADVHTIQVAPSTPATLWFGCDGGVWRSTDSAATWTTRNTAGFSATQFESLATHSTDSSFMIGGTQDNGTECFGYCRSVAAGTWTQGDGGDGGFTAIDQGSATVLNTVSYHTYYNQTNNLIGFTRSDDPATGFTNFYGCNGGVSNNAISCTDATLFYAPLALGPGAPNTVYFGTDRLYRSPDKGVTVSLASQAPLVAGAPNIAVSSIGISPQDDNVRIVGLKNGKVWSTSTGSTTLADITGAIPAHYIARAVVDPNNKTTAYVTLDDYGLLAGQHVWKTTNLSAVAPAWFASGTGIPDVPTNAFVVDPANSNLLYAGTDIGVYRSTDAGASWSAYSTGLPRVAVFDMAFQGKSRVLRIATHGRGIYEIGPFSPGRVPDAVAQPGQQLKGSKSGGSVKLDWNPACSFRANDSAIYQGTIGIWYSHAKLACSTSNATTSTFPPGAGDVYFLVVPRDGQSEGSYGVTSSGAEIPPAPVANQCAGQVMPINCN